uniref:Uncharacterized protein n=1 Tax=Meloidogyne enterolobii TaxID=390850 RepID=A0A6V7XM92_MELEN|nr:unnamed protein product [Meloidogyne enterolobii]
MKVPLEPRMSVQRDAVLDLLKQLASDNEDYFKQIHNPSIYNRRILESCKELCSSIDLIREIICQLQVASQNYDYDENTPGNGFRSLICISDIVLLHLISVLRICSDNRTTIMFRLSHCCKEIEAYVAIIRFLILAYQQVVSLLDVLDNNSLFPPLNSDYQQYNIMFRGIENLDASCFYGRSLGFQFSPSITRIFRVIGLILATYSLSWESTVALSSLIRGGRMLLNPEQRAKHIIKVTREASIGFCRGFWNLSELTMPSLYCPVMATCEKTEIKLAGTLSLESVNGGFVQIHEPSSHTGPRPIALRVLSFQQRFGLNSSSSRNLTLSPYLVIHCHGGGYVATSSKSHETYLRYWAKSLECPLISIDYSLAPENPFPRPTEEVLYAYAWILINHEKFGWTGEKVCLVGDSAGGNLIVSVSLKLVELGVKRLPDGLVPIYTPFLFQYLPSPSRVLSFMDPLLHMGVVIRCAAAYSGTYTDEELDKDASFKESPNVPANNGHRSLQDYVDQVQRAQNESLLDFTQGSQSIVSLINLSLFNKSVPEQPNFDSPPKEDDKRLDKTVGFVMPTENVGGGGESQDEGDNRPNAEDDEEDSAMQSVRVDADPAHIFLSTTNFDQCLIDYLQIHPITKSSINTFTDQASTDSKVFGDESEETEVFTAAERSNDKLLTPTSILAPDITQQQSTPSSTASSTSFFRNILHSNTSNKDDSQGRLSYFSPGSSLGCTPLHSKKRLSRNKSRSLSQSLADTAALAAGHATDKITEWLDTPMEPLGSVDKKKLTRAATMSPMSAAKVQQKEAVHHHSHFTELLKLKLPREHLMSPMYTPAETLAKLPPIRFVACHLDPLLDDTIMFAKKVRDSGGKVHSVDLLDSLPHGFLNFSPMSSDCQNGANICLERIKQTLGMP